MKILFKMHLLIIFLAAIICSGCSVAPKTFKTTTLDDMYPILTSEQYTKLNSLTSDEEVNSFLDNFWHDKDSTSGFKENLYKTEYLKRLEYANANFPDRKGWGRSDRKKIYLIYGPPKSIERKDYTNDQLGKWATIKSVEIWSYMTPGKDNSLPSYGDSSEKKFIFADMIGSGNYTILYSSEDGGDIDVRMFK